jgi:hypothetical protein
MFLDIIHRPNATYRKYNESAHMSLTDHPISQPSLDISPICIPVITAEIKIYNSVWCRLSGKICVGTIWRICLSIDDLFSDSSLVQGLTGVVFLIL